METFKISGLTFSYPDQGARALDGLDLTVKKGEFLVICGPSGCGKSTLLRMLKPVLAPHGTKSGSILFEGRPLEELDQSEQSRLIGFVQQSPEDQIVTDKVWHELAFGLESLGADTPTIRRRVAEMASFFGIETWFYKNVTELSGGQKQLLNLASVMVMQPTVLILDEPTSQLDPIAASEFLSVLKKINTELGTTVILTEHRLEEALSIAGRVAVMDGGRVICEGTAMEVGRHLKEHDRRLFLSMPAAMRIWAASDSEGEKCPVTVRQGRDWLEGFLKDREALPVPPEPVYEYPDETAVSMEGVWFRYEKDSPDVIKGLDLEVKKGEFVALLGGNGTGKTTTLKLIASLLKPYRGTVKCGGTVGVLPQNPQTLFVKKTVREDLLEVFRGMGPDSGEREARTARIVKLCRLEELLDRHPYDLSGGEQQRAALAKILLLDPEILLMDEPTKGFDAEFKLMFAEILKTLIRSGRTILMVSHDVEFCAGNAHRCALFFDGNIVNSGTPRAFFSGNSFYTTAANRMSRGMIDGAVTAEDVITALGGETERPPEMPEGEFRLPPPAPETPDWKPEKLPLWRRILAAVSGIAAAALFIQAIRITDLKALVDMNGLTDAAPLQFGLYAALIAALAVFTLCVSRKSKAPAEQTRAERRRLPKRTVAAAAAIIILIPLTLFVGVHYLNGMKYYFIALLILLECMAPFFLIFEGRKPQARELVIIAVLCAIGVAGRAVFFMLPYFKPVLAVVIIAGVAFGGETGFLVGAVTMLVSNIMFSQGPWTPWQMFAAGIIGFIAGILFRKGLLRRTRGSLAVFGALAAIIIYGGIMNPAAALMYLHEINWKILLTYYMTGVPVDLVHAAATAFFLWIAAEPMLEKLDRIKTKYGLVE